MLDLYLAGPLDAKRYLAAKGAAVRERDAGDDHRPAALHLRRLLGRERGADARRDAAPAAAHRRLRAVGVALFYTALSMAISSLTTRRAVAAVATVLVLLVSSVVVGVAVESGGAPDELALLTYPASRPSSPWRTFGDERARPTGTRDRSCLDRARRRGLAGWIALGAAVLARQLPAPERATMSAVHNGAVDRGRGRVEVVRRRRRRLRRQLRRSGPGSPRCSARTVRASRRCCGCCAGSRGRRGERCASSAATRAGTSA